MIWELYTDGACSGNGRKDACGGWAFVILRNGCLVHQDSGGEKGTTNQRMELMAAIKGCNAIHILDPFAQVRVYSDSAYLVNCWKQNWWRAWRANGWKNSKKEPVANQDLWEQLIPYLSAQPNGYDFIKVKGHAGDVYNELCDKLAVAAVSEVIKSERNSEETRSNSSHL